MKATGIVRKIDELGRIVIPKELRIINELIDNAPVEIFVEDDKIILTKYHTSCIFCNEDEEIVEFKNKYICKPCLNKIAGLKD
ncbi:AbrB/MazE/SpoVT family DNA-binding domain-containing protein [Eubacteriales bacterium OttesenSCG-928-G02]|nr:AbrB/MazE/SpoVT family DNA-binding domain-containing protein [Eubacteriales bacterium OttesenSCG-928-G02]